MVKRLAYICIFLLSLASPLSVKSASIRPRKIYLTTLHFHDHDSASFVELQWPRDTVKVKSVPQSNHMDVIGKKIKEVAKPKHQSKPEKVVTPTTPVPAPTDTAAVNKKAKRQRRPEGLERPPELPRRGGN